MLFPHLLMHSSIHPPTHPLTFFNATDQWFYFELFLDILSPGPVSKDEPSSLVMETLGILISNIIFQLTMQSS